MSNSLLVDLDNEPGDIDALKKSLSDAVTAPEKAKKQPPAGDESQLDDIDPKYRGKSLTDIIEMHKNAESELGRRGNELGQYKSLTDQLLSLKRSDDLRKGGADPEPEAEVQLPSISSTDLLENPTEAIGRVVETALTSAEDKRRRKAEEEAARDEAQAFSEKHPDAEQVANDPKFIQWVQDSPSRSLAGFRAAQGNLTDGDALLTEWKALQEQTEDTDTEDEEVDPNVDAARKAGTESAGASKTPDAPTGKTYRRLDLIRLKLTDPEAYADPGFQSEIMKAYAEGRVK